MEKKIAMKWVKALRSNKFKQGTGQLMEEQYSKPRYCCLGVLGVVCGHKQEKLQGKETLIDIKDFCGLQTDDGTPLDTLVRNLEVKVRIGNQYQTFESLAEANDRGVN